MAATHNSPGRHAQFQRRKCSTAAEKIPALTARNTGSEPPEWWLSNTGHPAPDGRNIHEVLEELKVKYPINFLCKIMGINRSGYYKWKARQGQLNQYEQDRILLTQLLQEEHKRHPSLGYHRLARNIFHNTGWIFSDNLAHKCCKAAGIRSKARKCRYKPPGEESIKYENLVKGRWNAKAPLQIVGRI